MKKIIWLCFICFGFVLTSCDKEDDFIKEEITKDEEKCNCDCCENETWFGQGEWCNFTMFERANFFLTAHRLNNITCMFPHTDFYMVSFNNDGCLSLKIVPILQTETDEFLFEPIEVDEVHIKYKYIHEYPNSYSTDTIDLIVKYRNGYQYVYIVSMIPNLPFLPMGTEILFLKRISY